MIFIWANKYFIWINQFKLNILLNNVIQRVSTALRNSREIPHSQLSYVKFIDLDQYSLYGGWHTQVNNRFSRL